VSPAVPPFVAVASTLSLLPPNTGLYAAVMSQPFTPALPTDSRSRSCREDPQRVPLADRDMGIEPGGGGGAAAGVVPSAGAVSPARRWQCLVRCRSPV
jgi:hypothetical protein